MPILLIIGVAIAGFFMFGAGVALLLGGNRGTAVDKRLDEYVGTTGLLLDDQPAGSQTAGPDVADRLDKAIGDRGFTQKIKQRIAQADVKLRVSEYIIIWIFSIIGVSVLAFILFDGSIPLSAAGGVIGSLIPRIVINRMGTKRIQTLEDQLSDTLNLWVNALKSGYSVLQGMESIATELPPPVSKEFERVVQEMRLGLGMEQALDNMLRRVPSEDLDLVVTAVKIAREVGGNLAEILDVISFTIRERVRIKGEIRTLTAQNRASATIITFLPIALAGILYVINKPYVVELFVKETPWVIQDVLPCGWVVVGIALIMIAIGAAVIRKIVDIEV